jgi:hypothetical protein
MNQVKINSKTESAAVKNAGNIKQSSGGCCCDIESENNKYREE